MLSILNPLVSVHFGRQVAIMDPDFQFESKAPLDRILIVNDDPDQVAFAQSLLERMGFTVTVTRDGGQAHGAIRMHAPDLVLMQVILPGESGFEITEKIKQRNNRLPVLVLTEVDLDSARNLAERVGADGYLTYPFLEEDLMTIMRQVVDAVWHRTKDEEEVDNDEKGVIRFQCRCGTRLSEKFQNRGKHVTCDNCQETVQVPNQTIHDFFTIRSEVTGKSDSLEPLKFVTVKCQSCATFYRLANVEGDWRKCPRCDFIQEGSLSIIGAPMSRAALESSLRVLRVLNGKSKGKKLMLPQRKITFGRAKDCDLCHGSKSVSDHHCTLEPSSRGLLVNDLGGQTGTFIDGKRVQEESLLKAASVLRIGDLQFRLIGQDLSVDEELNRVQAWSQREASAKQKGIRLVEAGKETAAEAAQVIQQHWNITRKRGTEDPAAATAD
jgi:two-component system OmpR family response regulator